MLRKHSITLNVKFRYNLISISAIVIGLIMTWHLIMAIFFTEYFAGIIYSALIGECVFFFALILLGILLRFEIIISIFILRYLSIAFIIDRLIMLNLFSDQFFIPFLILEVLIAVGYGLSTYDKKLIEYLKSSN